MQKPLIVLIEDEEDIEVHRLDEHELCEKDYEMSDEEDDEAMHPQHQGVNAQQCAQQ